jgi:dihydroorotate dehydrogenase electron transfer subunit
MRRPIRGEAEIIAVRDEGGANRRLALRVPGWPGFDPGQFVMLSPGPEAAAPRSDPLLPRPMAVYRARDRGGAAEVEILFKVTGRGTALLGAGRPGERVRLVGPLGHGFPEPEPGEGAVIVAGGTGVASVYPLAARLARTGAVRVLLGARSRDDLLGRRDFASLGADLDIATDDGSEGLRGVVTDLLPAALDADGEARIYTCGPTAMMERTAAIAAARGRPCVASLENPMACGFGVCLGCAVPLRRGGFALVCRDGPMFDAANIAWEGLP